MSARSACALPRSWRSWSPQTRAGPAPTLQCQWQPHAAAPCALRFYTSNIVIHVCTNQMIYAWLVSCCCTTSVLQCYRCLQSFDLPLVLESIIYSGREVAWRKANVTCTAHLKHRYAEAHAFSAALASLAAAGPAIRAGAKSKPAAKFL